MSAAPAPIVYCETNWIVALAFPHHQLHSAAKGVHDAAKRGECSIRIPGAAILEAKGALSEVSRQLTSSIVTLRNDVMRARENGLDEFEELWKALRSRVFDEYTQRNTLPLLKELDLDPSVRILDSEAAHTVVVRELRDRCDFAAKDVVDVHLLAAIIHDRRLDMSAPAVFFSHNRKEFSPGRKVPADLYTASRLVWSDDFDLKSRLAQWRSRYEMPLE